VQVLGVILHGTPDPLVRGLTREDWLLANAPTVEQWVAHPDALDRLLDGIAAASARYNRGTAAERLELCHQDTRLRARLDMQNRALGIDAA
jgi:Ser/Thr protein kinase RdoA (MazF antagonist)